MATQVCWGCGQPAPGGVCAGPHGETWKVSAAENMYFVEDGRKAGSQTPWNRGRSAPGNRSRSPEARVERAIVRLANALDRYPEVAPEHEQLVAMAWDVVGRRQREEVMVDG